MAGLIGRHSYEVPVVCRVGIEGHKFTQRHFASVHFGTNRKPAESISTPTEALGNSIEALSTPHFGLDTEGLSAVDAVPLHNRWYSSTRFRSPTYANRPTRAFPSVYNFEDTGPLPGSTGKVIEEMRFILERDLTARSALVFRGMDRLKLVENDSEEFSPQDLNALTECLGLPKLSEYVSGLSVRSREEQGIDIFQASDEPPSLMMEPHTEMAYLDTFPGTFFMYCEQAAACGGGQSVICYTPRVSDFLFEGVLDESTFPRHPIGMSDKELALIGPDSEFITRLRTEGCRYEFFWPESGYMNWRFQLRVETKAEAETAMVERGLQWRWEGDDLVAWLITPVCGKHPETGKLLWWNQVAAAHGSYQARHPTHCSELPYPDFYIDGPDIAVKKYENLDFHTSEEGRAAVTPGHKKSKRKAMTTCYANGDAFAEGAIDVLRRLIYSSSTAVQLQKGDLIVLDNFNTMHGRFPWRKESKRKLYVALCNLGKWHGTICRA